MELLTDVHYLLTWFHVRPLRGGQEKKPVSKGPAINQRLPKTRHTVLRKLAPGLPGPSESTAGCLSEENKHSRLKGHMPLGTFSEEKHQAEIKCSSWLGFTSNPCVLHARGFRNHKNQLNASPTRGQAAHVERSAADARQSFGGPVSVLLGGWGFGKHAPPPDK